jgi:hypothetical protein
VSEDPKFDLDEAHQLVSEAVGTVHFFQRHYGSGARTAEVRKELAEMLRAAGAGRFRSSAGGASGYLFAVADWMEDEMKWHEAAGAPRQRERGEA